MQPSTQSSTQPSIQPSFSNTPANDPVSGFPLRCWISDQLGLWASGPLVCFPMSPCPRAHLPPY
jgi:hypothetical protein